MTPIPSNPEHVYHISSIILKFGNFILALCCYIFPHDTYVTSNTLSSPQSQSTRFTRVGEESAELLRKGKNCEEHKPVKTNKRTHRGDSQLFLDALQTQLSRCLQLVLIFNLRLTNALSFTNSRVTPSFKEVPF